MYSESLKDICLDNTISSYTSIFNESKIYYYNKLFINIKNNINQDFNLFKTNFNNTIDFSEESLINNFILNNDFNTIINNALPHINISIFPVIFLASSVFLKEHIFSIKLFI